jgi:hypothetical protein
MAFRHPAYQKWLRLKGHWGLSQQIGKRAKATGLFEREARMPSWLLNMDVVGMLLFSPLGHSLYMSRGVEPCDFDPNEVWT